MAWPWPCLSRCGPVVMSVAELWTADLPASAPEAREAAIRPAPQPWAAAPELAVVIPTLNERDNVPLLVERLNNVLAGLAWEAIFVDDDSPDGTADVVRALARRQPNIRCVQRLGRRGLASACIEGVLSRAAAYDAEMDRARQQDESLHPDMMATLKAEHHNGLSV